MRQVSGRLEDGASDAGPGRWNRNSNQFPITGIQELMGKELPSV